jgi:hypothetical protein
MKKFRWGRSLIFTSMLGLLSGSAQAMSGARVVSEAERAAVAARLEARLQTLYSDAKDTRNRIFYHFANTKFDLLMKRVQTSRLRELRCQDDWLTTPQAARARLEWVMGCLSARTSQPDAQVAASQTPEAQFLNQGIQVLLQMQLELANQGQAFKYPTLGRVNRNTFVIQQGKEFIPPHQNDCSAFENDLDLTVVGLCNPGCFTPEQTVLFSQGYLPVGDANIEATPEVVTLSAASSPAKLEFVETPVRQFVNTPSEQRRKEGKTTIIVIEAVGGFQLRLSEEHPVLMASGVMKRADEVSTGDQVLSFKVVNGSTGVPKPVRVTRTSRVPYFGNLVNVDLETLEPTQNVIVSNGILVGSNLDQTQRGRDLMGKQILEGLLPTQNPSGGAK